MNAREAWELAYAHSWGLTGFLVEMDKTVEGYARSGGFCTVLDIRDMLGPELQITHKARSLMDILKSRGYQWKLTGSELTMEWS